MNNEKFKKLLREFIESRGENLFNEGTYVWPGPEGLDMDDPNTFGPWAEMRAGEKRSKLKAENIYEIIEDLYAGAPSGQFPKVDDVVTSIQDANEAAKAATAAGPEENNDTEVFGTIQGCCNGDDTKIYNIIVHDSFHARSSAIARGVHKNEVLAMVQNAAFGKNGFLNQYLNGKLIVGTGDDAKFAIKAKINRGGSGWNIWLIARYYPTPGNGSVGIVTVFNEAHKGEIFSGAGMKQQFDAGNVTATIAKIPSLLPWGDVENKPTHNQGGNEVEMPEDIYLRGHSAAAE